MRDVISIRDAAGEGKDGAAVFLTAIESRRAGGNGEVERKYI